MLLLLWAIWAEYDYRWKSFILVFMAKLVVEVGEIQLARYDDTKASKQTNIGRGETN